MRVTQVSLTIVEVPQVPPIAPYRSRYRSSSTTRKGIVRILTDAGLAGWGEFNINFLDGVDPNRMQREANDWLAGRDPRNISRFHAECPFGSRLKAGLELALWDLKGKALGRPVAELLGGVLRREIELAACMGIKEPAEAADQAVAYADTGFSTLKCKGGAGIEADVAMIAAMREAAGDRLAIRLDPNTGYSLAESIELARRLEPYRLEYLAAAAGEAHRRRRGFAKTNEYADRPQRKRDRSREPVRDPESRCRGVFAPGHASRGRHLAVRGDRRPLESGGRARDHALRARPRPQDRRHAAHRRRLPGVLPRQRLHILRPGR